MKRREFLLGGSAALLLSACATLDEKPDTPAKPVVVAPRAKPRVGLALGGGAARGFAHIGVIKALETSGVPVDIVVGTSAGSVVGAIYAAGFSAFELQKIAFQLEEGQLADWSLFDRGVLKGEALERFINQQVGNRAMEGLKRRFAAVATDVGNGELTVFTTGNVGQAVRASSAIPGVFSPVTIRNREYIDGGAVSPIPVHATRSLGADIVIAVDISGRPSGKRAEGSLGLLLDTTTIMGNRLAQHELRDADVIIRPDLHGLPATNFEQRHEAIRQGELAGYAAVAKIREKLAAWEKH